MNHVDLRCASWIVPLVDPARRRDAVSQTRHRISQLKFDAVAFTGLSGSVIAGAVASEMDKYLYCVRKSEENRHSGYQVEGPMTGLRYIVIDERVAASFERHVEKNFKSCAMRRIGGFSNGESVYPKLDGSQNF